MRTAMHFNLRVETARSRASRSAIFITRPVMQRNPTIHDRVIV